MKTEMKDLVYSLIELTKSGDVIWTTDDSSNYERKMSAISGTPGSKESTTFGFSIKYKMLGNQLVIDDRVWLFVRNANLPEKMINIYSGDCSDLIILRDLVKGMYANDMNPTTDDISNNTPVDLWILSTIRKINFNLSGSFFRDKRIDDILNEE